MCDVHVRHNIVRQLCEKDLRVLRISNIPDCVVPMVVVDFYPKYHSQERCEAGWFGG
jgi:hypothetical protein